ncbi:MAG: ArsA family ATPase [Chloroflexi bacterium]|nr:ArsA family ATPase [Chloroflexota bacterium]
MRLILYTGKGGVGKTTIAAASGMRSAELGFRTLVVSTDIAHSLADVIGMPLEARPVEIAPNLWAQEINVLEEVRNYWGKLQEYLAMALEKQGVNGAIAEELAVIPGMEEVVSLLHIRKQAMEGEFDRVVVDAAPTGETMRLLTMPESFQWYAGRIINWSERTMGLVKPIIRALAPGTDVLALLPKLMEEIKALRDVLTDRTISSYRVVVNPEKMVIKEAERALSYLFLFQYPVDAVIVNRVLPPELSVDPFLRHMQEIQKGYLKTIENTFRPLPLWYVSQYDREMVGLEALSQLAQDCFGAEDPGQIFYTGQAQEIVQEGENYLLRLPLPWVEKDKVSITKRGDELFVTIGNFKREIMLPNVLTLRRATRARFSAGVLEVQFSPPTTT